MQIQGSVCLVTGADRELGRRLTEELLRRGAAKVYGAVGAPNGMTTPGVVPLQIDITDPASVTAAAHAARDTTLLVNNVGTYGVASLLDGNIEDIRALMDSHYFGTLTVTRAVAPHLIANAPSAILNIVSVRSWLHPRGGADAYALARTALWAQTNAVRAELEPDGVAVTALHVGHMGTNMATQFESDKANLTRVAVQALDGVEHGLIEVLADELSR
ncbi:SDR family oxidoreductase [Mycolicibacterium stellerae]|uniref:SDR family oxidoreductase n=1 Tax=Mycolicibacterium stellerae TaxID=2358193 RepID=UPI000F0B0C75|nr:SDR family oxidoreductase [Mycolicibacterium stellerae]